MLQDGQLLISPVVVALVAGGAVDKVPGSRTEPSRRGDSGGSNPLDPGGLEVGEEVIQVEVGGDEF